MMDIRLRRSAAVAVLGLACALAGCASVTGGASSRGAAAAAAAQANWDGLLPRESQLVDQLFVRPDVKLGPYSSVMIDKTEVAFDKSWDPNRSALDLSRRMTPEDMQKIKSEVGQMLNDTFARALQAAGYSIVTTPRADTLRISPSIVDLYINAPDIVSASRTLTYVMDAGRMTLVADFRDAHTGQLVARAVDKKRGTDYGRLQIANSVTNSAEAQVAMNQWAQVLVRGLNGLKAAAP